mmetsp:Transcript_37780/g.70488  ORF Transcript_37780/g.70488 Transcript_37780/m.70488 type:complete len:259 (+) Transcript_37780:23-799(+)
MPSSYTQRSFKAMRALYFFLALTGATAYERSLRGLRRSHQSPCHCQIESKLWARPTRTEPRCVFIDLGAGVGNDLEAWAENKFGPVANCPSGEWEAILIEANPVYSDTLNAMAQKFPGKVQVNASRAAYMCEAKTAFYINTNEQQLHKASAGSAGFQEASVMGTELSKVEVDTVNVNRLLTEHTIPGDWVTIKMDVEGAEFDIVPCMAESPAGSLVDRLYVEQHDPGWGLEGATPAAMQTAMTGLRTRGVDIPSFSPV